MTGTVARMHPPRLSQRARAGLLVVALVAGSACSGGDGAGMAEVSAALDDAGVYAASLFLDVDDLAGDGPLDAPWVRGAVATALDEDGDPVADTVLWHRDDDAASDNVEPLAEVMDDTDRCTHPATEEADGRLLVASCPYEGRWATEVTTRMPAGPLFG